MRLLPSAAYVQVMAPRLHLDNCVSELLLIYRVLLIWRRYQVILQVVLLLSQSLDRHACSDTRLVAFAVLSLVVALGTRVPASIVPLLGACTWLC